MIATTGYNPETETLVVQFNSGAYYRYDGVPADVFVGMVTNQESHGRAFNQLVKPAFAGTVIQPEDLSVL